MSSNLDKIKQQLAEFADLRNRADKPALTNKERLDLLNKIYDGALYWLLQAVVSATAKGTGAATLVLERARQEIVELQRAGKPQGDNIITIKYERGLPTA